MLLQLWHLISKHFDVMISKHAKKTRKKTHAPQLTWFGISLLVFKDPWEKTQNVHLRRYTPNHCSMRRKSALAPGADPENHQTLTPKSWCLFFKGRRCLGFGVAIFCLHRRSRSHSFGVWCNNIGWTLVDAKQLMLCNAVARKLYFKKGCLTFLGVGVWDMNTKT